MNREGEIDSDETVAEWSETDSSKRGEEVVV